MKIAFVSPEVVPFSKTGGLADVSAALPAALKKQGAEVKVFSPRYLLPGAPVQDIERLPENLSIEIGGERVEGGIFRADGRGGVETILIDCPKYFERTSLYTERGKDFADNAQRFAFLSRGALEACLALGFYPDVFHANDWQTGLLPVYLRRMYADTPLGRSKTVHAINNLGYQGLFEPEALRIVGLTWDLFNFKQLEFYGKLNFLKAGLAFADGITTVSPTYAEEIKTPEYGLGLDGVLRERAAVLRGIVNGADYEEWNPEKDALIPVKYGAKNLSGKSACKRALQTALGLRVSAGAPLLGSIGRLTSQKGYDILAEAADSLAGMGFQLALLGSGEEKYEAIFHRMRERYPAKAGIAVAYDERLAHMIQAGSDMFVMPSRYEPCGLTQIYSLRYGTIPIVRSTGGLNDTISQYDPATEKGNGFKFSAPAADELIGACRVALELFGNRKAWLKLVKHAMTFDFSWAEPARKYISFYRELAGT